MACALGTALQRSYLRFFGMVLINILYRRMASKAEPSSIGARPASDKAKYKRRAGCRKVRTNYATFPACAKVGQTQVVGAVPSRRRREKGDGMKAARISNHQR